MKALIVGLGGIGQRHARNLRALLGDHLDLIAYRVRGLSHVISPQLEADASRNIEMELGIRSFSNLGEALAEQPAVAFVCNPSSMHVGAAKACLQAGCDLFVEKPLSDRMDGVAELVRLADEAKRIAMVGFQLRFHPCVKTLQTILEGGSLGSVLAVRATIGEHLPSFHTYEDYREGYAARPELGGGVVLTQIHEFDYLDALFGHIRSVYALGGRWSDLEIQTEDVSSALMEGTADGRPLPIHLHQDYVQVPAVRQCEVIGSRGKALADFRLPRVTVSGASGPHVHSFEGFDRNQTFLEELRHFLDCVERRLKPIVDLRDGARSLRTALAVKESMRRGAIVPLGHDDVALAGSR